MTDSFYSMRADQFFADTVNVDVSHLYEPFLSRLPRGGRILDAGCGSGRDARRFKTRGYEVVAFDASKELAELASRHLGQPVLHMRFADVPFAQEFDGIWACASLLHVPKAELPGVLTRLGHCLKPRGAFYLSFKFGFEEVQRDGRHFTDLDERALEAVVKPTRLRIADIWKTNDARPGRGHQYWLSAVLTLG